MSSLQSESYVEITLDILRQSNIVIKRQDDIFNIQGNQTYQPISYEVEGDYSQAAFFMVAGTIGQRITLSNLTLNSLQGDRKVISIINQMGGHIEFDDKKNQFTVHPSQTIGIEIDLNDIPDLGPILMVLASLSKGKTTFKNVERLRYKESDRLSVMMEILTQNGIKIELNNEILIIEGKNSFIGGMAHQTHGDHRIAMALAIMSIRCESSIIIEHAEVVSKSYPDFFEVFKMLGGKYE
jgi:3-phosphoshikimate 1-carboxyvinyltransferase